MTPEPFTSVSEIGINIICNYTSYNINDDINRISNRHFIIFIHSKEFEPDLAMEKHFNIIYCFNDETLTISQFFPN